MKIFSKISIPVSLAVVFSVATVVFFAHGYLKQYLFDDIFFERKYDVLRASNAILNERVFRDPYAEESQETLSRFITLLRAGDVIRLTVWDTGGTVISSDLSSIIGKKAVRHEELAAVYRSQQAFFTEKDIDDNDPIQSTIRPVRIALVPIFIEKEFVGVVEIHMANAAVGIVVARSVNSLAMLLIVTGGVLILSMAFIVRRVIVNPIHEIAFFFKKIQDGDFSSHIKIESEDEIGSLAEDFNQMKVSLERTIDELERRQKMAEQSEQEQQKLSEELRRQNDSLEQNKKAMINIVEDITESEEKLRVQARELERFRLATNKSFNHTVITDPDGYILYANEAAVSLTGFSLEEMRGKTPSLWGKQMPHEFYVDMWHRIKTEKKPFSGEITNRKKDGTLYIASARIVPIVDDGEVSFFVATENDITEVKRQREQEMQYIKDLETVNQKVTTEKVRAEAILRYLRSIGEAVFATDKTGTIVFSNATAANMVGATPEDIIEKSSQEIFRFCIGDADKSCDFLPFYEAIKFKKTLPFSPGSFLLGKGGKKIPISGTLSPIIEVKHIAGAIVVFQDITDRYELERMKDRFLSVAAHQLRTPLGSMRWSMELLEDGDLGKLPKKAKEVVGELRKNSNRMMLLINDLLSVSRINQSEVKESFSEENIADIVQEAVQTLRAEAEKKSIVIRVVAPKKLPNIPIIRKHIFEAVENLISNAIRYGKEKGNIQISIAAKNGFLTLQVADDGIGIPKNAQDNIFSKFFRAENAIQYFTDGSGLGLSVVKSYIEESKGSISFESKENIGTTFIIKLPVGQK